MTVHCRRNVASLTAAEQRRFRDAVFRLHERGDYQKYAAFHGFVSNLGHFGPAFLPWHRQFILSFEQEIQAIDSGVSLPYWDFGSANVDPNTNATLMWTDDLFKGPAAGNTGPVDLEWVGEDGNPRTWTVNRNGFDPTSVPVSAAAINLAANMNDYQGTLAGNGSIVSRGFRNQLERSPHGGAHVWLGIFQNAQGARFGDQASFATAVNDPIFMLLHANVDRLWSIWQQRQKREWAVANPGADYPVNEPAVDYHYDKLTPAKTWPDATTGELEPLAGVANRHNLDDDMWPWDGTRAAPGNAASEFAPWNIPGQALSITPRDRLKTVDQGFVYDTDMPHVELVTPSINFNAVPIGETTSRAAVFEVMACGGPATIEVVSTPGNPFSLNFGLSDTFVGTPGNEEGTLRIWTSFTGTAGLPPGGTIRIRCVETQESWDIPITTSSIAKPTVLTALVLDRSGSMGATAGLGDNRTRMDVLKESASMFVDALDDLDGIAVTSFNHDATPDIAPQIAGPPVVGAGRVAAGGGIGALAPNGGTSIGDGLAEGHGMIDNVGGYQNKAIVVFTDGHETAGQTIAQAAPFIDSRVFAIGLGDPGQLNPVALDDVTDGSGGFLMMTGDIPTDELRLGKFFLQVLSGVTNAEVVVDPQGNLRPGQEHRVKFSLTDADYRGDVYLLLPHHDAIHLELETPSGVRITPANAGGFPGVSHVSGDHLTYYRFTLPVPIGPGSHAGTWTAVLTVNDRAARDFARLLRERKDLERLGQIETHGIPYRLLINARSSLKMRVKKYQKGREPGATVFLEADIDELGVPLRGRARVVGDMTMPGGRTVRLSFAARGEGHFTAEFDTGRPGAYTIRVRAKGQTVRGLPFTREQLVTAAVWKGGNQPPPKDERDLPEPGRNEQPHDGQPGGRRVTDTTAIDGVRLRELFGNSRFRLDLPGGGALSGLRFVPETDDSEPR